MEKVRVGIIGLGNMGGSHAKSIVAGKVPGMEVCAVCDTDPEKIQKFKDNVSSFIPTFDDAEKMMDSGYCNAIVVAIPHYDHPKYAMMAMSKGLHVMVEKPAGVYTKQVREMNEFAKEHDVVFGMMFNQRTNHVFRKVKEVIDSGELGAIKRVNWIITTWYRSQNYYDSGCWRATWDGEGGGVLVNQCPHNLDLLQWICGLPSKVTAFCHEGKWHDIEVEDDVTAYLEFPNGATGVFVTSTGDAPGTNRLEILCEKGRIICEDTEKVTMQVLDVNEREFCMDPKNYMNAPKATDVPLETDGKNEQHMGVFKAFAGKILNGTPLIAEGTEGINGVMLSNSMLLSSWLGKTIELPVDEDVYLEELNKRRATSRYKDKVVIKKEDEVDMSKTF